MLHYYFNLPKDYELSFDKNKSVSKGIYFSAKKALDPFDTYLQNVIKSLEQKENIKAKWEKVPTEKIAELELVGVLYKLQNYKNKYKIITDDVIPDFEEKIICKIGSEKIKIEITQEEFDKKVITLDREVLSFDSVLWNGDLITLQPIWNTNQNLPPGIIIDENEDSIILYNEKLNDLQNLKKLNLKEISSYVDFDNIFLINGTKCNCKNKGDLKITLDTLIDYNQIVISNNIKFKLSKTFKTANDKDNYWIQLKELDKDKEEEIPGLSPLKYFFDDEIKIEVDNKNDYKIALGNESENKILLKKGNEYCFPPENSILKVKANTYQVKKQLEAINTLMNMPIGAHSNLIKLFEKKENAIWKEPRYKKIDEWFVITDETRDGSNEQRKFVNQAINTPDFAILEGPPGSGKTTVILELICQLIKQGKRILLCGSTHVAIDNVLERLNEKKGNDSLINDFNILPIRIGDEQRISEEVREFQLKNVEKKYNLEESLLLDLANLVCGTTIGILQHPKFKERKGTLRKNDKYNKYQYNGKEPIIPEFDYLIIDESSKTTFQEFLVPALYAKKWVLVGDVMQLSPFTDREETVSNIENLNVNGEAMPFSLQQAMFYLFKIKKLLNKEIKIVLPLNNEVLKYFKQEFTDTDKIVYYITKDNINLYSKLELVAADLIVVDKNVTNYIKLLPESHTLIMEENWFMTEHAFLHNAYQKNYNNNIFDKIKEHNRYFKDKSWAEEIAWRIDREHQIRLTNNKYLKRNYNNTIENYIPKSWNKEHVEKQINAIAAMAFPSILESLVIGISGRKSEHSSTISDGFNSYDLDIRRTTLKYQHRMHPEISIFPRNRFYNSNALLDLKLPRSIEQMRDWNYTKYNNRTVWINVNGKTDKGKNKEEVTRLIKELKDFLDFTKKQIHPEGKQWNIACLTFYRGQENVIREQLQKICDNKNAYSNFKIDNVTIKLHTVDKFQGQEADVVFLSMVQTERDGFLDNPNRLNVAITRAKYQLIILGNYNYYSDKTRSEDLKELAKNTPLHETYTY